MHLKCWQWVWCERVRLAIIFIATVVLRIWRGRGLLVSRNATAAEEIVKFVLLVSWLGEVLWVRLPIRAFGTTLRHQDQCPADADEQDDEPDDQDAGADNCFLTDCPVQSVGNPQYRGSDIISSALRGSLGQELVLRP